MSEEESTEKEFEPSSRKLDEARRQGDIARAPDLSAGIALGGLLLVAVTGGSVLVQQTAAAGMAMLDRADALAPHLSEGGRSAISGLLGGMLGPIVPFLVVPGLAALLVLVMTRGLVFAPSRLAPRLSRLDPITNARHKFGPDGLAEFLKSFFKLCLAGVVLWLLLAAEAGRIVSSLMLGPGPAMVWALGLALQFLGLAVALTLVIGLLDLLWQRHRLHQRNRMSRKEMTDEMKEQDGDPHLRAERQARAQAIAGNRMLTDVGKANVVIVNPTHYAVALSWDPAGNGAPVCVAKGVDEMAARIRERAATHGVPIRHDPPTARALHASVEIGAEIRPEHYRAVAAAIRFAEAMRKRAVGRKG